MSHVYVIDSGVLFSIWTKKVPEGVFATTMSIVDEIHNKPSKFRTDILELLDRLQKDTPPSSSIRAVVKAADETGDRPVLSDTDIELVALAHSKKGDGVSITLVSTDMAVLNVARYLGIDIIDPSGRFRDDLRWILICPACNHKSEVFRQGLDCPVCGTQMRRKVLGKARKK
jgi:rRNA maturation endonuclease Nob1